MSIYSYKGRYADGRPCKGWTEAETTKAARSALFESGILTESITEAKLSSNIPIADRARFYNGLGVLLNAGFTIEQAFGLLLDEQSEDTKTGLILSIRDLVRNGTSLSEAMSIAVPSLSAFERTALETSEAAGLQGRMLTTLSEFIESEQSVTDKIKAALAYPLVVLALATGLLSLMIYFVLPRAISIFSDVGNGLPRSVNLLATWGPRGMTLFLFSICMAILCGLYLKAKSKTDSVTASKVEKKLCRIPVMRKTLPLLWAHRFSGTMSLLLGAGVPPQSAISVSGAATGSQWLTTLSQTAAVNVKNGMTLSNAISTLTPVAPLIAEWIKVGESSGSLGKMLEQASIRCRQSYEMALTKFTGMLEPLLIIAVGIVVLIITSSVLIPMLQLAKNATI